MIKLHLPPHPSTPAEMLSACHMTPLPRSGTRFCSAVFPASEDDWLSAFDTSDIPSGLIFFSRRDRPASLSAAASVGLCFCVPPIKSRTHRWCQEGASWSRAPSGKKISGQLAGSGLDWPVEVCDPFRGDDPWRPQLADTQGFARVNL